MNIRAAIAQFSGQQIPRYDYTQHEIKTVMSEYSDIAREIYASVAARPQRHLPRIHETSNVPKEQVKGKDSTTTIDHGALFLAAIIGGLIFYWHYQAELNNGFRNWGGPTRAIRDFIRRLALDLVRFILSILGIIAQIVLFASETVASFYRRRRLATSLLLEQTIQQGSLSVWRRYDTINHSPELNHIRQSFRRAYAIAAKYLPYPVSIAILVMACFEPPDFYSVPEESFAVEPDWVVKAQNRLLDSSSCHYT
ncbi:hypothetical protein Q7P37_009499 [Cladosporium fusiforme]